MNELPREMSEEQFRALQAQGIVDEAKPGMTSSSTSQIGPISGMTANQTSSVFDSENFKKTALSSLNPVAGVVRGITGDIMAATPTFRNLEKAVPGAGEKILGEGGFIPSTKEVVGSALQTGSLFLGGAAGDIPFSKGLSQMAAPGLKTVAGAIPRLAGEGVAGAVWGAGQAMQENMSGSDIAKTAVYTGLLNMAIPVAGAMFRGVSNAIKGAFGGGLGEKLMTQIFKNTEDDIARMFKSETLVNLAKEDPVTYKRMVTNGIIKDKGAGPVLDKTLAREALERGLMGSTDSMAQLTYLNTLQAEEAARALATPTTMLKVPQKENYAKVLSEFLDEFKKQGFSTGAGDAGFLSERVKTAQTLLEKMAAAPAGQIDAETALWVRRYIDDMRQTKSYLMDPVLSAKQEALKTAADKLRGELATQIKGEVVYNGKKISFADLMDEYRFNIDAFDALVADAKRRGNTKLLNLTDMIVGGGGLAGGYPGTGLGAAAGIRAFQTPVALTNTAAFVQNPFGLSTLKQTFPQTVAGIKAGASAVGRTAYTGGVSNLTTNNIQGQY